MKFQITATLSHPSFGAPVIKRMTYEGASRADVMAKIEAPSQHKFNLEHHGRAKFKDGNGVVHNWVIKEVKDKEPHDAA